jgi:hypothetical protein
MQFFFVICAGTLYDFSSVSEGHQVNYIYDSSALIQTLLEYVSVSL